MKNSVILFLLLTPAFLFAQYPNTGNKARLGYQTTGDGLIWRGVAADTVLKPRVIAHAYFQLDTVNAVLRRYIATKGSWQVVGATPDLSAYLLKSDTAAMLVKYIERGDTATMLAKYIERGDTAAMLANYPTFGDVATSLGNYLPIIGGTLTGTGGAGFIGFPSQVTAPGTPASGLNIYAQGSSFNFKGTDGFERQFGGTITGGRTYTLPDVSGTFALGTGTADRLARWTATNTLGPGNLSDNGTRLAALLPWQFQTYTTAGLPTGVTGYHVYNTTTNGPGWYQGSRWAYGLESTFNRGTATYFPYFDANGQITNSILSQSGTEVSITGSAGVLKIDGNSGANTGQIFFKTGAGDYSNWIGTQDYNMTLRTRTTSQKIVMEFGSAARAFEFRGGGTGNMLIIASTPLDLTNINSITSPSFVPLLLYSDLAGSDQTGLISRRSTRTSDVTQPDRPIHSFQYGTAERARITIAGQLSLGGSAPDASSIVDIVSTARGFLLPRMNTTNRNAITSPASTLLLANTDSLFFEARISGAWKGIAFRDWVRSNFIGSTSTIYGGNGTIGTSRIATITDSIRFQFGGSDLLRLKSNGVLHVNMPTEASSFVITSTPNENYNNYRGQVFLTGTTSAGDTATATRRNNHEASYFSGINLVEGGNNVYYDAVAGYGNIIRGNQPKNIAFGIYNTINSGSDNGAYGFNINITGSNVSAFGRDITIAGSNITAIGRSNTITQNNSFVYGSNISGGTNLTQHGFGTVAPAARVHVKSISGSPTIYAEGGSIRASDYGAGAMEAADLSKTESVYDAVYATDGTVLERHSKVERYYTITSTSSPQTLSNDYSDNLINQGGTQATFTLTFPASPVDGQVLKITYNNAITTLTLDGNGNTIVGSAVTTGVAGSQRKFKFYSGIGWIKLY